VLLRDGGVWRSEYMFRGEGHALNDFAEMCDFQQYAPESHFRKGMLCSIMTDAGRKTLTETSFITTENGSKVETPVSSKDQFYEILAREFEIVRPQV
jgi:N-hydroxyarylamine O-acetyltransferase